MSAKHLASDSWRGAERPREGDKTGPPRAAERESLASGQRTAGPTECRTTDDRGPEPTKQAESAAESESEQPHYFDRLNTAPTPEHAPSGEAQRGRRGTTGGGGPVLWRAGSPLGPR